MKITSIATAGLGNRIRSIASAVNLAEVNNSKVLIYWRKDSDCAAEFSDLFQDIRLESASIRPLTFSKFYLSPNTFYNLSLLGVLRKGLFAKQYVDIKEIPSNFINDDTSSFEIYISSCHSFYPHFPLNLLFDPIQEIKDKINLHVSKFNKFTLGLHIRRTDNLKSIENNSILDYFKKIEREIKINPSVNFYLSTDDQIVRSLLIENFTDRIIFNNGALNRNTLEGMKNAVVDLWSLSKTSKIIGSFYSSYSEIAAELGQINLEILKK